MLSPEAVGSFGEYRADNLVPAFVRKGLMSVFVEDSVRRCVAFVGTKTDGRFRPRATAFLVSVSEHGFRFAYLVTAEHVITGLLTKGMELFTRANRKDGTLYEGAIPADRWVFHPNSERVPTDVAVCEVAFTPEADVLTIPLNGDFSAVATEEVMRDNNVGVGDEIAIIGLFRNHYGQERNIPIVRIGNLAAMPEEPVMTSYCGYTDAYLIEARSISGLSGSPVFLNMPPMRVIDGGWRQQKGRLMFLLGLVNGHFDVKDLKDDSVVEDDNNSAVGINTGVVSSSRFRRLWKPSTILTW